VLLFFRKHLVTFFIPKALIRFPKSINLIRKISSVHTNQSKAETIIVISLQFQIQLVIHKFNATWPQLILDVIPIARTRVGGNLANGPERMDIKDCQVLFSVLT